MDTTPSLGMRCQLTSGVTSTLKELKNVIGGWCGDHQAVNMCAIGPQRQSNGRTWHVRWGCEVSGHSPAWGDRERGQCVTFHREADAAAARATRYLRLQLGTGDSRAKGLSLGQPKMHICVILAGTETGILGMLRPGGVTMVTLPTSSFDIHQLRM